MRPEVILTHTCRDVAELDYGFDLTREREVNPLIAEFVGGRFSIYAPTTRESYQKMGRITDRITDGSLFTDLNITALDPQYSRIMICGSIEMNRELKAIAESYGLREGSITPAEFVLESVCRLAAPSNRFPLQTSTYSRSLQGPPPPVNHDRRDRRSILIIAAATIGICHAPKRCVCRKGLLACRCCDFSRHVWPDRI